ncbi:MAG: hypothetical protein JWN11_2678 [Hyphomicrobiales bacterium]|nr:hypothetical protein [Hyphomicrobiales bacterium]
MRQLPSSLLLAGLLVLSLGLKVSANIAWTGTGPDVNSTEAVAFLQSHGFSVVAPDPLNDLWVSGSNDQCWMQIATVSALGWERDAMSESALGARLSYVYAGNIYPEQPVLLTALNHYWQRLQSYLRQPSHQYPVRAIITSNDCPANLLQPEILAKLSR